MKPIAIFVMGACLLVTSCATYSLVPRADADNKIRRNRGTATVSAVKHKLGVAVSAEPSVNSIYFKLYVKNFGDEMVSVDDSLTSLTEEAVGALSPARIKVYRADEYYKKRRNEIIAGEVLMAFSAAMSTANAGYRSSTTYGSYTRNDFYHSYGTFSATTYSYDAAAAAMERDIAFERVNQFARGGKAELDFLKNALFYPSDLEPNGDYYGIVVSDFGENAASTMTFSISLNDTPFTFVFDKEPDQ